MKPWARLATDDPGLKGSSSPPGMFHFNLNKTPDSRFSVMIYREAPCDRPIFMGERRYWGLQPGSKLLFFSVSMRRFPSCGRYDFVEDGLIDCGPRKC